MQSSPINNLEHYNNYVRALLPPIPHFIESCSYTDSLNWECVLSVALLSESDCMKWLTDFTEISKTQWRVNENTALTNVLNKKVLWGMVYGCETPASKNCPAKLECKILSLTETDKIKSKTTLPCLISIHFHHNHPLSNSSSRVKSHSTTMSSLSSALKDQFEGFFLETLEPRNGSHPLRSEATQGPRVVILNQGNHQIISSQELGVVFDIEDVNNKLDEQLSFLKALLKQSGTGCAAVKQFTDQFDRLKNDADSLENALINFGTAQILQPPPINSAGEILSMGNPVQWAGPTAILDNSASEDLFAKTNNNLVLTNHNNNNTIQHNGSTGMLEEDEDPLKAGGKKGTGKKKKMSDISPGQIDPVTGKRKKRSRCGTCSGCINRDKTQDCRECRNCLDQKRYGGPGRLKKACIKRSCVVMCTAESSSSSSQHLAHSANISLPIHPVSAAVGSTPCSNGGGVGTTTAAAASSSVTLGPQGSVLSWPAGTQFAPTFQVQQPVQFTYQPQGFEDTSGVVSGSSGGTSTATSIVPTTVQYTTPTTQSIKLNSLQSNNNSSGGRQGIV